MGAGVLRSRRPARRTGRRLDPVDQRALRLRQVAEQMDRALQLEQTGALGLRREQHVDRGVVQVDAAAAEGARVGAVDHQLADARLAAADVERRHGAGQRQNSTPLISVRISLPPSRPSSASSRLEIVPSASDTATLPATLARSASTVLPLAFRATWLRSAPVMRFFSSCAPSSVSTRMPRVSSVTAAAAIGWRRSSASRPVVWPPAQPASRSEIGELAGGELGLQLQALQRAPGGGAKARRFEGDVGIELARRGEQVAAAGRCRARRGDARRMRRRRRRAAGEPEQVVEIGGGALDAGAHRAARAVTRPGELAGEIGRPDLALRPR